MGSKRRVCRTKKKAPAIASRSMGVYETIAIQSRAEPPYALPLVDASGIGPQNSATFRTDSSTDLVGDSRINFQPYCQPALSSAAMYSLSLRFARRSLF